MSTRGVSLRSASKRYGDFTAVSEIDLEIPGGGYYCLLGPSGSGKSTILRLIAGLETLSSGQVLIGDADVSTVPANRRPVHTVFQSYALFPRMSVFDNVAYGLRAQRAGSRAEIAGRVHEALAQVRLAGSEDRRPAQLSGGMQQRVALARALVNRPEVLLLDEPLGALDLKLRREMQDELVRLQHESQTTFVHVTHDQEECFACASQVAVMRLGAIEQVGSPREVYRHPATEFAASFLGSANLLAATIVSGGGDGSYRVRWDGGELDAGGPPGLSRDRRVALVIRPEEIEVAAAGVDGDGWIDGTLLDLQEAASTVRLRIAVRGLEMLAERSASAASAFAVGAAVAVRVAPGSGWLVDSSPSSTGIVLPTSDEPARSGHGA
ncbi:MAG: ABC transporter ATP-binding protein [Solirubrobacteraceae bacterium]